MCKVQIKSYVFGVVTQLGFNQPVQWTVTGNNETGYTIEIAPDKQFLTAVDNIVKSSDESTLWNIVDEGEERYKFVQAVFVVNLY